ncbi:MAG: hypothetical protein GX275_02765 [Clostridiales bacterium]|nr:hypothetical protein [Clostridiales bacterium]
MALILIILGTLIYYLSYEEEYNEKQIGTIKENIIKQLSNNFKEPNFQFNSTSKHIDSIINTNVFKDMQVYNIKNIITGVYNNMSFDYFHFYLRNVEHSNEEIEDIVKFNGHWLIVENYNKYCDLQIRNKDINYFNEFLEKKDEIKFNINNDFYMIGYNKSTMEKFLKESFVLSLLEYSKQSKIPVLILVNNNNLHIGIYDDIDAFHFVDNSPEDINKKLKREIENIQNLIKIINN